MQDEHARAKPFTYIYDLKICGSLNVFARSSVDVPYFYSHHALQHNCSLSETLLFKESSKQNQCTSKFFRWFVQVSSIWLDNTAVINQPAIKN
jgi:hypothetical protein